MNFLPTAILVCLIVLYSDFLLKSLLAFSPIYNDAAEPWEIGFQDSATTVHEGIVSLHDNIMFYLILIIIGVLWMILTILYLFSNKNNKFVHKYIIHGTLIEIIWTIAPAFILIAIAFPSFELLYLMDEVIDPAITIKAVGHQWYWSYEYADYVNDKNEFLSFDSYMIPTDDLEKGDLRLLEVDNKIIIPINAHVRVIVSAADVLHSWAIPSLGVKVDAVPGRLNQTSILIKREGTYYGQCSEICGVQHAFMPIAIEAVPLDKYIIWVSSQLEE
jgi:cytochrome c oxidase subunit 2